MAVAHGAGGPPALPGGALFPSRKGTGHHAPAPPTSQRQFAPFYTRRPQPAILVRYGAEQRLFWGERLCCGRSAPLRRAECLARDRPKGGESGQGIQALRLADAPGGEGSPFAPTRSDCRQCDLSALAQVSRSLGFIDGVSRRGSQHRSTDRPKLGMSDWRARRPTQTSGKPKI